jgi:hypothetical protein
MNYVDGKVFKQITSSDGERCLDIVARNDGLFQFRAYDRQEDEYLGTYWSPSHQSGLYDRADLAEAAALREIPWLRRWRLI